jgi:hypothetical protein
MEQPSISTIPFLVVSKSEIYRSKSLIQYLEKMKLTSFHVQGIPAKEISLSESTVVHSGNGVLSNPELACSLSHITARSMGLSLNADWIFVLEDDAVILDESRLSKALSDASSFFGSDKPIAITFFPGQYGVFRKFRKNLNYFKILKVPDYSVATLYSKKALITSSQTIKGQIGQLPDWPKVLKKKLQWFAINDCLIDHPAVNDSNSPSYIRQDRLVARNAQKKHSFYKIKVKMKYLVFLFSKLLSNKYSSGTIETEKLRSRVLWI